MEEKIGLADISDVMLEVLKSGGEVRFTSNGWSMAPLLSNAGQQVVLKAPGGKVKKGDIAFYRRKGGQFVLHRVVRVKGNTFTMCGDNQVDFEPGITREQILAVMTGYIRDGKLYPLSGIRYFVYKMSLPVRRAKRRLVTKVREKRGT